MPLEIMIPIETLGALITLEGSVGLRWSWSMRLSTIKVLHAGRMTAVEIWSRGHAVLHAPVKGHMPTWAMDIRHDRAIHRWQRVRWIRSGELMLNGGMASR